MIYTLYTKYLILQCIVYSRIFDSRVFAAKNITLTWTIVQPFVPYNCGRKDGVVESCQLGFDRFQDRHFIHEKVSGMEAVGFRNDNLNGFAVGSWKQDEILDFQLGRLSGLPLK